MDAPPCPEARGQQDQRVDIGAIGLPDRIGVRQIAILAFFAEISGWRYEIRKVGERSGFLEISGQRDAEGAVFFLPFFDLRPPRLPLHPGAHLRPPSASALAAPDVRPTEISR